MLVLAVWTARIADAEPRELDASVDPERDAAVLPALVVDVLTDRRDAQLLVDDSDVHAGRVRQSAGEKVSYVVAELARLGVEPMRWVHSSPMRYPSSSTSAHATHSSPTSSPVRARRFSCSRVRPRLARIASRRA